MGTEALKDLKELLQEADAASERIAPQEAMELLNREDVLFVDVRESHERAQGCIPGSFHAPRGFLEFMVHPKGLRYDPILTSGKRLVLYCSSGNRSALAAKTLNDMGVSNLFNLWEGLPSWLQAGGKLVSPDEKPRA